MRLKMAKDIEPKLKKIPEYLKIERSECFVIPEYQRGYSWSITQCDKLYQDIENFMDADQTDPYFFGTIIVDCSDAKNFNLVDGQQRTTTFLLLLKALLLRITEVLDNFTRDEETESLEQGLREKRNSIIDILYKTDSDNRLELLKSWNNIEKIQFLKNKSINEIYKEELQTILNAKTFDIAETNCIKIPKKQKENKYTVFFKNFKFFYDKLSDYNESKLNKFAKTFLEKCQIIEIRSWQLEQAITMFNSLNSTGMPLSDADIISASLYSNVEDNKDKFNETWKKIIEIANALSSKKIIDIDSVLQEYMYIKRAKDKEYIKNTSVDVTTPGVRNYYTNIHGEILKNPKELCENFLKIAKIWNKIINYPIIKLLLKFNENIKIYLISYLNKFEVDDISEESVLEISECLIRLFTILELVDAGYSSSNFKTFLFGENVKLVDVNCPYIQIKSDFDKHISEKWNKEDLRKYLLDYNKNVLVFLNEYLYAKEKELTFDFDESVNIEHIMPASGHNIEIIRKDAGFDNKEDFDAMVNTLGNKILLEENINKSISNDWFKTKKQTSVGNKSGYNDSKYNIAKTLVNYNSDFWEKEDINNATNKATDRILKFIFNDYNFKQKG